MSYIDSNLIGMKKFCTVESNTFGTDPMDYMGTNSGSLYCWFGLLLIPWDIWY
ncbi:Uncharacterised protein [Citrobacter youngae]|nr:Uncharacterised protein [Citrobacter youngae]